MTSRARPQSEGSKPGSATFGGTPASEPLSPLKAAFAAAAAGGLLLAAGAVVRVVTDAPAGFTSWPVLVVLALGPIAVVAACVFTGRQGLAAGLLLGLAALAPGRLVVDLQFFADASLATRPELYLPTRLLDSTSAGAGAWLLVAGHVLTAVAGFFAASVAREQAESAGLPAAPRRARALAPLLALVASVALLMAPMQSEDAFLLAKAAFDGPWLVLLGLLLMAGALPLAAALGAGSSDDGVAKGCFAGLGIAVLAVVVPNLVSALALSSLEITSGPVLAVIVAALLIALAFSPWASSPATATNESESGDLAGEARLPGLFWWRLVTGSLALLTAVASVIGALAAQLSLHPGVAAAPPPESPARWLLLVAGLVLGVLGLLIFVPAVAVPARAAVAVVWAGVLMAGAALVSTAATANDVVRTASITFGLGGAVPSAGFYDIGPGVVVAFVALGLATLTALAAVVAGVVEREDAEDESRVSGAVVMPVVATGVLAVVALGLPTFDAPGYVPSGLWSNFDIPSWGLLVTVLVVLGGLALAVRSRPIPSAAVLIGVALLLALRAAELPLVGSAIDGSTAAIGFWLSLASVAASLVAAVMAATGARRAAE